ncbi:EamA family transporter RarD [Lujinxingia litoralis]|uniref:EamA family transporter RarD n=1 Tax=Lujinxingia litoralis TaxID=2211119 RepID=A0A328CDB1_9DELT|nr:EamA family transporter RarD [Lujinxingia litoralis]
MRSGLGFALGAYLMWGFFPIYWKLLEHVPAMQILAHRMVWSLGFVALILGVRNRWAWVRELTPRALLTYLAASLFLAFNWGMYIWAVNAGYIVETALGYFINPLFNVVIGAIWLGERPRRVQWMAIGLAALGVVYLAVIYGQVPLIALSLASSFAIYGLIKKKAHQGAIEGVALESALLFLPALAFLVFWEWKGQGHLLTGSLSTQLLLIGGGAATMMPLLFFAAAVRRLSLTVIGVMQYIGPTIQFLIGVFIFHEPLTLTRLVGFLFIWAGLLVFTAEGLFQTRRTRRRRILPPGTP